MISIVIPLYNKEHQIANTLQSVFAQTYTDYEIVIVNDGSTDKSAEVVEKINDPRIRLIQQQNAGVSAARNKGIEESRGEYIALLDADDEWKPNFLATINNLVNRYPDCDMFATSYEFKDQNGFVTRPNINKIPFNGNEGLLTNYFEISSCSTPPICSSAVVFSKSAIVSIGLFPVGVRLGEDLITWARLACKYKIAYSTEHLAIYVFASQAGRVVPKKQPNKEDYVGNAFKELVKNYDLPYLKNTAALWHKMRMVTFVQLQMRKGARHEFEIIKSYIRPTKKDIFWYIMSFMPISVVQFILKSKSGFK